MYAFFFSCLMTLPYPLQSLDEQLIFKFTTVIWTKPIGLDEVAGPYAQKTDSDKRYKCAN